jgi:hypothetical protein
MVDDPIDGTAALIFFCIASVIAGTVAYNPRRIGSMIWGRHAMAKMTPEIERFLRTTGAFTAVTTAGIVLAHFFL